MWIGTARASACALFVALACGCGGSGSGSGASGSGGPSSGTITVNGKVLQLSGTTVSAIHVAILGQGVAITDSTGNFTIANVTTPYDVAVAHSDGLEVSVVVYLGLVRANPRLTVFPKGNGPFTATVSGTLSGGAGYPEPANHQSRAMVELDVDSGFSTGVDTATGAYSQLFNYDFDATTTARLTAVQFLTDVSGMPVTFTGAFTSTFPVADLDVLVQNAPLAAVATTTVSGTYTVPAGYTFGGKGAATESNNLSLISYPSDATDTGTFSLAAPVIAGRSILVQARAFPPAGNGGSTVVALRNVAPGSSGLVLPIPEAPSVIFPFTGATGIDHDSVFFATDFSQGIHIFQFLGATPGDPDFIVCTNDASARIPDLSGLGIPLPAGAPYSLQFAGLGPFANLEAFTGPGGPLPSPLLMIVGAAAVDFTTAP